MQKYIESLKDRPDHHKRRIAFTASATITAIIFILWVTVIFPSNTRTLALQSEKQAPVGESPINTLQKGVAQAYEGIKSIWSSGNDSIQSANLEEQYKRIKGQVENGDIKLAPAPISPDSGN
jgi:hypothetical protein